MYETKQKNYFISLKLDTFWLLMLDNLALIHRLKLLWRSKQFFKDFYVHWNSFHTTHFVRFHLLFACAFIFFQCFNRNDCLWLVSFHERKKKVTNLRLTFEIPWKYKKHLHMSLVPRFVICEYDVVICPVNQSKCVFLWLNSSCG